MPPVKPHGGKFQLRGESKLLPRPCYSTFDAEKEAVAYDSPVKLEKLRSVSTKPAAAQTGDALSRKDRKQTQRWFDQTAW